MMNSVEHDDIMKTYVSARMNMTARRWTRLSTIFQIVLLIYEIYRGSLLDDAITIETNENRFSTIVTYSVLVECCNLNDVIELGRRLMSMNEPMYTSVAHTS
jgi:hypothetical protein